MTYINAHNSYRWQLHMLVFVVSVTVRAHLVQFKLIANKTDEH